MRLIRKLTLKEATDDAQRLQDERPSVAARGPAQDRASANQCSTYGSVVRQPKLANQAKRPAQPKLAVAFQPRAKAGAGGGNRTHTTLSSPRILSPVRLPVSPPRPVVESVVYADCLSLLAALSEDEIDTCLESRDLVLDKLNQRAQAGKIDTTRLRVFTFNDTIVIVYVMPSGFGYLR